MVAKHLNANRVRIELDQLVEYYGQLAVNNFTIDGLGLGLYVEASIIDHSCSPNACTAFYGTRMQG